MQRHLLSNSVPLATCPHTFRAQRKNARPPAWGFLCCFCRQVPGLSCNSSSIVTSRCNGVLPSQTLGFRQVPRLRSASSEPRYLVMPSPKCFIPRLFIDTIARQSVRRVPEPRFAQSRGTRSLRPRREERRPQEEHGAPKAGYQKCKPPVLVGSGHCPWPQLHYKKSREDLFASWKKGHGTRDGTGVFVGPGWRVLESRTPRNHRGRGEHTPHLYPGF